MLNTTPLQSNSDVYSPLGFCYLFCWGVISSWELSSCPLGNIPPNGVKGWNYHPKSTWKVGFMYPVPRGIWSLTDISPSPPPPYKRPSVCSKTPKRRHRSFQKRHFLERWPFNGRQEVSAEWSKGGGGDVEPRLWKDQGTLMAGVSTWSFPLWMNENEWVNR